MKHKPVGLDIIMALGGGKHGKPGAGPVDEGEDSPSQDSQDESELPPDFQTAYDDYKNHPSAEALWEAIK